MSILTLEGVVEDGHIRLNPPVSLPERTRVYVIVPDVPAIQAARMPSPRLADPAQAGAFRLEVIEIDGAGVQG